jgi:hypothetical protein
MSSKYLLLPTNPLMMAIPGLNSIILWSHQLGFEENSRRTRLNVLGETHLIFISTILA